MEGFTHHVLGTCA